PLRVGGRDLLDRLHGPRHRSGLVRPAGRDGRGHVPAGVPREHGSVRHRGQDGRAMSTRAPANRRRGRGPRLSKWTAMALIAIAGLGVCGVASMRGTIEQIAAALPVTPDLATLPVSTAVVDRNGQLLRPFTTDGRWRLPV